ncbi:hypothetical protein GCM10023331_24360 [Algivirga pacifica]|uniref:Outer membrane protein beta-barrel domain-containing protein n=2 Tax=Algivirga pacifica TaxID=1162670 RepID=A0ABP9DEP4_9BACT
MHAQTKWYVKAGVNWINGFQVPETEANRLVIAPEGIMNFTAVGKDDFDEDAVPLKSLVNGLPVVGVYASFPFLLTTGLEYQPLSTRTLYRSKGLNSTGVYHYLKEYNTVHSLSIPLFLDFRRTSRKSSIYGGARLHFNLFGHQIQKSSWSNSALKRSMSVTDGEIDPMNLSYVGGFNYGILNFELAYYPKSVLNANYVNSALNRPYLAFDEESVIKFSTSIILGGRK